MTSRVDSELVLFLDSCTGEIVIEGISCDYDQTVAKPESMREFRTGLVYEDSVAAKIRLALNKRGVKVKSVPGKCINISNDWLVQILAILYYGLDHKVSDRLAYLTNAANSNSEWKNNPGSELQKLKEKEYWNKVKQFNRLKRAKTASAQHSQPKRHGIKTLVVDDELVGGNMLALYISPLGECDLVNNGSEAIKAFNEAIDKGESYDLITLDIVMPEMNGDEVLKRIRNIEEERGLASTKIIMITAMDDAKVIMSAFKEQCDGYLVKPIRKVDLMKRLCELNLLDH
jgi:two-component system chemotaxis response regulator CheY